MESGMTVPQGPFDFDAELGSLAILATNPSMSTHRRVFLEVPVSPGQPGSVPPSEPPTHALLPCSTPTWPPVPNLPTPSVAPLATEKRASSPSLGVSFRANRSTGVRAPVDVTRTSTEILPISRVVGDDDYPPSAAPPAYIATAVDEVPAYSRVNKNPETLARYLFKHGFCE